MKSINLLVVNLVVLLVSVSILSSLLESKELTVSAQTDPPVCMANDFRSGFTEKRFKMAPNPLSESGRKKVLFYGKTRSGKECIRVNNFETSLERIAYFGPRDRGIEGAFDIFNPTGTISYDHYYTPPGSTNILALVVSAKSSDLGIVKEVLFYNRQYNKFLAPEDTRDNPTQDVLTNFIWSTYRSMMGTKISGYATTQETANKVKGKINIDIDFSGSEVESKGFKDKNGNALTGSRDLIPDLVNSNNLTLSLWHSDPNYGGGYRFYKKFSINCSNPCEGIITFEEKLKVGKYKLAAFVSVSADLSTEAGAIGATGQGKDLNDYGNEYEEALGKLRTEIQNQSHIDIGLGTYGRNELFLGTIAMSVEQNTSEMNTTLVMKPYTATTDWSNDNCSIINIIKASVGFGNVMETLMKCLWEQFIAPLIKGATEFLKKAAGISRGLLIGTAYAKNTLGEYIADKQGYVYQGWGAVRSGINIILVIALLLISFTNILRVNLNSYAVKKALPNLFFGIILANLSFLIIKFLADVSTAVTYFFVADLTNNKFTDFADFIAAVAGSIGEESINTIGVAFQNALGAIFLVVLGIISIIVIYWLAFLFYARLAIVYLLTILSPIAFLSYGIPGFEKYFNSWWQNFIKWIFMLPAMTAVLWLAWKIADSGEEAVLKLITIYALVFTACTLPLKWGGAIMQKASDFFRNTTGVAYGQKKLGEAYQDTKERVGLRAQQAWGHTGGKWLGLNKLAAKRALDKENMKKDIELLQSEARTKALKGRSGRNKANLEEREKINKDKEAAILAKNETAAFARVAKERLEAEFEKREQISLKNKKEIDARREFLVDEDEKVKSLVARVYNNVFEEKRAGQEYELQDSIKVGNVARSKIEILRVAESYRRNKERYDSLEDKTSEEGRALEAAIQSDREAFDHLKNREYNTAEFSQLNINDVSEQLKKPTSEAGRRWKATLGQGRKIFNEGVAKQSELLVNEGTVSEIKSEMDDFLNKFSEFGDKADEMRKLFLQGNTAKLQVEIDRHIEQRKAQDSSYKYTGPDLRDGIVATETMKKVLIRPNDIRHGELLKVVHDYNKEVNPSLTLDESRLDQIAYRREVASQHINTGLFAGVPDVRLIRSEVSQPMRTITSQTSATTATPPGRTTQATIEGVDTNEVYGEEEENGEQR